MACCLYRGWLSWAGRRKWLIDGVVVSDVVGVVIDLVKRRSRGAAICCCWRGLVVGIDGDYGDDFDQK